MYLVFVIACLISYSIAVPAPEGASELKPLDVVLSNEQGAAFNRVARQYNPYYNQGQNYNRGQYPGQYNNPGQAIDIVVDSKSY